MQFTVHWRPGSCRLYCSIGINHTEPKIVADPVVGTILEPAGMVGICKTIVVGIENAICNPITIGVDISQEGGPEIDIINHPITIGVTTIKYTVAIRVDQSIFLRCVSQDVLHITPIQIRIRLKHEGNHTTDHRGCGRCTVESIGDVAISITTIITGNTKCIRNIRSGTVTWSRCIYRSRHEYVGSGVTIPLNITVLLSSCNYQGLAYMPIIVIGAIPTLKCSRHISVVTTGKHINIIDRSILHCLHINEWTVA